MTNETMTRTEKGWLYQPKFPDHWEHCSLYSMANWVNGLAFREINFSTSGMPIIKIAEIKEGISSQTKFTKQTFDESVRVRPGDLLFSWSGQPETSIDAFRWSGPEGWLNQHVFRVTPIDGINPIFFYYLLHYLKPHFIGIARNKQTTGLGHVTKRDLENIQAAYPVLSEQLAIANILGTLDGKIQLNKQMNKTLEDIAQAIFKRWFIDFEFPNENGEPYKSSGGEMVESELGMIPKGWDIGIFSDLCVLTMGLSPKGAFYNSSNEGYPLLNGATDFQNGVISPTKYTSKSTRLCKRGELLICVRGTIGNLTYADKEYCLGRGVASVSAKEEIFREYIFFILKEKINHLISQASGSVILGLSKPDIENIRIIVPPKNIVSDYHKISFDIFLEKSLVTEENTKLSKIRDLLLPKLMTGKIRVPLEEQNVQ